MQRPNQKALANIWAKTRKTGLIFAAGISAIGGANVFAQEGTVLEEQIVTGTRLTIQNSIDIKRNATQIVDGLSADEIGDIPALSIGDALETLTGATSHRENGGATEVSVRGLGPFLGTTVMNGREATNGGGNRAVNYSIFPSEMFNAIAIHKTQSAEYIEGAVSGQVHLDTKRPIEYGSQLIQANIKGAYSPDESGIQGGQDIGSRMTFAYIDQFDLDNGAALGVSLGVQVRDETNPEQEYHTTSGGGRLEACELTSFDSNALPTTSGLGSNPQRCMDGTDISNDNIQNVIDGNDAYNSVEDIPFAYIPRDHRYRHNTTDDEREAIFGSIQWQPNDRLDILVDFQHSERDQREMRKDLQFASTQEEITALTSNPYIGLVTSSVSETNITSYTTDFQRLEEYNGYGINVNYQLTDNLSLSLDYGASDTKRTETDVELRLGATENNLEGANADDFRVQLDVNQGSGAAIATLLTLGDSNNGFEVTDPSYYNARNRGRIRARQIIRDNTLDAFRADLNWNVDADVIHTVKTGFRASSLEYFTRGGLRDEEGESLFEDEDLVTPNGGADSDVTDAILDNVLACADATFPESGFLANVRDQELINNAVSGTSVSEFATFDFECAANAWLVNYGGLDGIQYQNGITSGTNDVTEDTFSYYLQADYETEIAGYPVRGNFGTRIVDTDITSVGYRSPITVEETDEGFIVSEDTSAELETDTQESGYTEVLPSMTVIVDLDDDLMLRGGIFRGMSRPDPNAYGNGRSVDDNEGGDPYTDLSQAINGITATGNPYLEPILSTNIDLGLEWYPNDDTVIAGAFYWKKFNGAFETVAQLETFNLDGTDVQGFVETTQISDDTSTLKGFELTASHAFDYLPGWLSGLGGKISYNYADSDFEFEDQHGGDGIELEIDQDTGETTITPTIGILEPAGLFGLSKHVSSTQLYWDHGKINIQAIFKTRSQYFQQYTRDTQGRIRYTADNETLDLRFRYTLNDNVKLSLEAKNILDEPRIDYRGVDGNILQALSYGPRIFFGATIKF